MGGRNFNLLRKGARTVSRGTNVQVRNGRVVRVYNQVARLHEMAFWA
jgi:hypothetical protein